MKKFFKFYAIFFGAVVAIIIISLIFNLIVGNKEEDNEKIVEKQPTAEEIRADSLKLIEIRATDSINLIEETKNSIRLLDEYEKNKSFVTFDKPYDIVEQLNKFQNSYLERLDSRIKSDEITKLLLNEEKLLKNFLKRHFIKSRQIASTMLDEEFYAQDINVYVVGSSYDEIIFEGRFFYLNKNKLAFLELIKEKKVIDNYRFKNVKLRSSKYDGGDSWSYNTVNDDEIKSSVE